ncbi:MAG: YciI family protein [Planctomycetes bacterium]|nr:YciI family protein [Planctomycetota bacterium]
MRYLLLIYSNEAHYATITPEAMGELMGQYGAFHEEIANSGVFEAAHRLKPIATATTVRVRDGKALTTDGPFAETKECLGGYYLIDVPNLDEAMKWAAKIPTAAYGSIEIRPIWEDDEAQM